MSAPDAPDAAAPHDWATLDAALDRALALDGADRRAYVDGLAPGLAAALAPLLRAALADDPVLDHGADVVAPAVASLARASAEAAAPQLDGGTHVGPYRIEALVGEGGMGRVYRARRADGAFDRTVALKVVRATLALAGTDVAARLRRERELLAALDHPGIARLVDGGETDDGVPYLVTDFVDGLPITDYAAQHGLSVAARCRLLVQVALAVDHAHRRLVVHRDLKPSNVLVSETDGRARAVVLDFGIAKLLDDAEAEGGSGAFPITRTGMRLLTPAYAAPELYEPEATVTTSADVYGLGALLYELLTGRRPHADLVARSAGADREPTRPSRAVTGPAEGATPPPGGPERLARALRGDLDTICLTALAPDPARRYASAAALADDLQRALDGRPVQARPESVAYVASRFVRRHRLPVALGASALAAIVVGLVVALSALADARAARAEAEQQAARAGEAAALLGTLFDAANPENADGRVVSAREALDAGVERVGEVASDALRGYLLQVLGQTYLRAGDYVLADSLLGQSVAVLEASAGARAPATARARVGLAEAAGQQGRPADALRLFTRAIADLEASVGPDDGDVQRARDGRVGALQDLGRYGEAAAEARRAVAARRRGDDPWELARALSSLGNVLQRSHQNEAALAPLRESLALRRRLYGPDHARTAAATVTLAAALAQARRYDEAEPLFRDALAADVRVYGREHPYIASDLTNLGHLALDRGAPARAVPVLDSAVALRRRLLPAGHPDLGSSLMLLAQALNGAGRAADAEAPAREALALAQANPSGPDPVAGRAELELGWSLLGQQQPAAALGPLRRARAALSAASARPHTTPEERARAREALARAEAARR